MRIALVTEEFLPSDVPAARVTREIVAAWSTAATTSPCSPSGRGQANFRGARIFWASRMTSVGAVREAMALARPDVCHLVDPRRLGIKAAEAAERLGVPTARARPARPGSRASTSSTTTPGCATSTSTTAGRGRTPPTAASSWSATSGRWRSSKVVNRLAAIAPLPGVRLVVLGDGPGAKALRAAGAKVIAHATGLERARCLATFDVLVQPRKREVYAPAVHEALASGVPVVAFDGGTAADVVRHEHNGLLVDTDRGGKAFARAVARLGASPDLRFTLAANARPSISHRSWDDAVAELRRGALPRRRGRPAAAIV